MPVAAIFTGLAWGMLLAAVGLTLWSSFRPVPGLSRAVWFIGWLAGGLLLTGAMLAWRKGHSLSAPTLRLILIAALAAPSKLRYHRSSRSNVARILPALILAGVALFQIAEPIVEHNNSPVTLVGLAMVFCSGLGARALGDALSETIDSWSSVATYTLLTLLASGISLVNLWQRGMMWQGTTEESILAGTWLAWSAVWLSPRERPRLRAVPVVVATLLLCWTAMRFS